MTFYDPERGARVALIRSLSLKTGHYPGELNIVDLPFGSRADRDHLPRVRKMVLHKLATGVARLLSLLDNVEEAVPLGNNQAAPEGFSRQKEPVVTYDRAATWPGKWRLLPAKR